MKDYRDTKIVAIGFGHLIEYLLPCLEVFLGENFKKNLTATTADRTDYARKKAAYSFDVVLEDNMGALCTVQPDVILFAPPPSVAPALIEEVLVPYFQELRQVDRPVPDLYVFPPTPSGAFYLDKLGEVNVVNILPNMTSHIAGRDVAREGYTLLTFPYGATWPEKNRNRLTAMFLPIGGTLEVPPDQVLAILASSVGCNIFTNVIFLLESRLRDMGEPAPYFAIARVLRYEMNQLTGLNIPDTLECGPDGMSDNARVLVIETCTAWYHGLERFLLEEGVPSGVVSVFLPQRLDSFLQICQLTSRKTIADNRNKCATGGGVLAKGLEIFEQKRSQVVQLLKAGNDRTQEWTQEVSACAHTIARTVLCHSRDMAGEPIKFGIDHHATLYALLSKHVQQLCGQEGRRVLGDATFRYGNERGRRMAENAKSNGDPLTMVSYFAYVEWTDEKGEMKRSIRAKSPAYNPVVHRCAWTDAWKRRGLLEYGHIYCQYADFGICAGFNPKNQLEIHKLLSAGDDICDFDWKFDMTPDRWDQLTALRKQVGTQYRKDFGYHTAHLYQSISDEFRRQLGSLGEEAAHQALEEFGRIFSPRAAQIIREKVKEMSKNG